MVNFNSLSIQAVGTNQGNWLLQLRHGLAWLLCFCFFMLVPLEFASLHWMKTGNETWYIIHAEELSPEMVVVSFIWSLVHLISVGGFLVTGIWSRFTFERYLADSLFQPIQFVYYVAWIQTLLMLISTVAYLFSDLEQMKWFVSIQPYFPHLFMFLLALFFLRLGLNEWGIGRQSIGFWSKVLLASIAVYALVYFFLDTWVTEPVAKWFSIELSSWREESISRGVREAEQAGWWMSFLQLLMLGIVGPIAEEILFRGVIQHFFTRWLGVIGGIWVSALTFALFHVDIAFLAPLLVLGLILAFFRAWFNSLWAPIAFHILNNSMSVILDWINY